MNKKLFVVRVGNYWPEICQYTIPTIQLWAKKNEWEYVEIRERKFPEFSPTAEKLQISKLGKDSDWNMLIDADVMMRPDFYDMTKTEDPRIARSSYGFKASDKFKCSKYFVKDGRNHGLSGGCVLSSRLTHDIWDNAPLEWSATDCPEPHIVDEFVTSTNVARFGLGFDGISVEPDLYIVHFGDHKGDSEKKAELVLKAEKTYVNWSTIWPLPKILRLVKN